MPVQTREGLRQSYRQEPIGMTGSLPQEPSQSGASHNLPPGHRGEQSQKNQQRHAGQKHKKELGQL